MPGEDARAADRDGQVPYVGRVAGCGVRVVDRHCDVAVVVDRVEEPRQVIRGLRCLIDQADRGVRLPVSADLMIAGFRCVRIHSRLDR